LPTEVEQHRNPAGKGGSVDSEFRKALFRRYLSDLGGRKGFLALGIGLIANLLMHYWAFDQISSALGLYRSMTLVIAGLSVDYFALILTGLVFGTWRRFHGSGFFRDLQLTGVSAWEATRPLLLLIFWLVLADALVETGIALIFQSEKPLVNLATVFTGVFFGLVMASWMAHLLVLMNQLKVFLTAQFGIILTLGFGTLFGISALQEYLHVLTRDWDKSIGWKHRFVEISTAGETSSWFSYNHHYTYFVALGAATGVYLVGAALLTMVVRRFAYRAYTS